MQLLRASTLLARLVLAWFALSLGVAVASPLVQPRALELVCTAGAGMQLVVLDGEGLPVAASHAALDCPACLGTTLPPPSPAWDLPAVAPAPLAQHPFLTAHVAALVGAPLPPRGPPGASR